VTIEQAQEAPEVVLGTFLVNSEPESILFDSGASHSFVTNQFVEKYSLPMSLMKTPLQVSVVWTSLGPLPRWVPGPTTRWAPGTTRLALHGT
jgi:hypothetical protein